MRLCLDEKEKKGRGNSQDFELVVLRLTKQTYIN